MKKILERNKRLLPLVFPIFIELFFVNLLSFLDTFMISKHASDSVSAIGNAGTVIGIFAVLLNVASVGVNVVTSQYLGAKDQKNASRTLTSGIIFNLSLAMILFLIVELFGGSMLSLIKVDKRYLNEATTYLKIVSLGLPFMGIQNVLASYLRAHKKPAYLMISSISANVLNVILNFILIFGIAGLFGPMGSKGAAIATLCSHIFNFSFAFLVVKILFKERIFYFKIYKHNLKVLLEIGLPSALESFCFTVANLVVMSVINTLDTKTPGVAASRSYLNMLLNLFYQFSVAFGAANQIIVGHLVGGGHYDEAKKSTFKAFFLSIPVVELIILVIFIFGKDIFMIFKPNNPDDLEKFQVGLDAIIKTLPVLFILELGRNMNTIFINALKSAGDVIYPLITAIFSMFFFMAFGAYFFGIILNLGLLGVFLAQALDECFRGFLMIFRFLSGRWKNKTIIKKQEC